MSSAVYRLLIKNININLIGAGFNPLFFLIHIPDFSRNLVQIEVNKKAIRILMASLFKSIIYKIKNLLV